MSEFRAREYDLLKSEVATYVAETRDLERYAVGAAAAVYAWLATQQGNLPAPVWSIPPLIALVGAVRSQALGRHIDIIASYLQKLEDQLGGGPGWESYFKDRRGELARSAFNFWLVFLAVSLLLSTLAVCRPAA